MKLPPLKQRKEKTVKVLVLCQKQTYNPQLKSLNKLRKHMKKTLMNFLRYRLKKTSKEIKAFH